jgi:hypothetical protein
MPVIRGVFWSLLIMQAHFEVSTVLILLRQLDQNRRDVQLVVIPVIIR